MSLLKEIPFNVAPNFTGEIGQQPRIGPESVERPSVISHPVNHVPDCGPPKIVPDGARKSSLDGGGPPRFPESARRLPTHVGPLRNGNSHGVTRPVFCASAPRYR